MNWYKKAQTNPIEQLLPYIQQAGITGTDREELVKVLNGQANNKFFVQIIGDSPTYYEHDKEKLITLLKMIANDFPNLSIIKYWQQQIDGFYEEGYTVTNKNSLGNLLNALKTATSQGMTPKYHRIMGEMYGYTPEEIEEFISKEDIYKEETEGLPKPSLTIQDIRTNQSQKLI